MKYQKIISVLLVCVMCLMPINSFAAGTPPKNGDFGQGTRSDPVRYSDFHQYLETENGISAPTAKFSILKGQDEYSTVDYEGQTINMYVGDSIKIKEISTPSSGNAINAWDFQMTEGGNLIFQKTTGADINNINYTFTKEGYYNFYLSVRDSEDNEASGYWGNWSTNGSHKALGLNPGRNATKETIGYPEVASGDDLWGDWHFTYIQVHVITNHAKADFDIVYKGNIVNDNKSYPSAKDPVHLQLLLEDKSTVDIPSDSITMRKWYYWDIQSGFKGLTSVMPGITINNGGREVIISNCDVNLPGSDLLSKGFKLEVTTAAGIKGTVNRNTYFVSPPPPPPPPGTADIYVYYLDKTTNLPVYPANETTYKGVSYGTYEIPALPDTTTHKLDTAATPTPKSVTVDAVNNFKKVIFYYNSTAAGGSGKPPIASVTGPPVRMAGESVTFSGTGSYDPDGTIVNYIWNIPNSNHIYTELSKRSTRVWYPTPGEYDLDLTVVDNDGLTGDCIATIKITEPIPVAAIDITGKLKENRKVTVNGSNSYSPQFYPISKFIWAITNGADARYIGTFLNETAKDMIFKKAQQYTYSLNITNTYGLSDSESKTITVAPDLAPVADFTIATQVLRDPKNSNYTNITATNLSKSTDGDSIKKTAMFYAYDSNNDGNFDNETWYYSTDGINWQSSGLTYSQLGSFNLYGTSCGNPGTFVLTTREVGKYKFEAMTIEDIPDADTMPSLLSPSDYKTGITTTLKPLNTKIVEVINTAPTVSFEVKKKKPIDVFIFTDYTGTKLDSLQSILAVKKAELNAINIDPNFVVVNTSKNIGVQTLKKYKYYRDLHFIMKITDGSATDVWMHTFPYYKDEGGRWETKESYEKPLNEIPIGRYYSYYSYINTTSSNGSFTQSTTQNYRAYDTAGGYNAVGHNTYYNQGSIYYNWTSSSVYNVYVDPEWKTESLISTDSLNVTSIDLSQIYSLPLRAGSDRYAFFLSDGKSKDYSQTYGNNFAFGELTSGIKDYIKQNNFSVYSIMDPKAMNTLISKEIGVDVLSCEAYTNQSSLQYQNIVMYKTANEYYHFWHKATNKPYVIDSNTFGEVKSIMYPGLVNMKDGSTKYFDGSSFKVFPINNVVTASIAYTTQIIAATSSTIYIVDMNTMSILKTYSIPGVTQLYPRNGPTGWYQNQTYIQNAVIAIAGTGSYIITDDDRNGTFDTSVVSSILSGHPVKKVWNPNVIETTDGRLLKYDGATNSYVTDQTNIKNFYMIPSDPQINSKILIKNDGTAYASYKIVTGQTYSHSAEDYINTYGQSPWYQIPLPAGVRAKQVSYGNYVLGTDNNLYTFAPASYWPNSQAPAVSLYKSNVSSLLVDNDYPGMPDLFAVMADGSVLRRYYSNYVYYEQTYANAKKVAFSGNGTFSILKKDGTDIKVDTNTGNTTAIITNNIAVTNATASYITINDMLNSNPNCKIYAAGQYVQALNDLSASYTADPSYSTNYILLGDTVDYKVIYQDYENDPKYREYWTYNHDANYFDNPLGIASYNGQTLPLPVTVFDKTGKFLIDLKVRDNPKNDDRFGNYRLYNQGIVQANLFVHRRPVALQRLAITNNGNGTYTVAAYDAGSYDLDHTSRADKGIAAREWRWKESSSSSWTAGQFSRSDCTADKVYIIQLRVMDLEGVWSDYDTIELDEDNPPAALFSIEKPLIATTEYLKIKDQSYPQSFCSITDWHWRVNEVNADGSETNIQDIRAADSNSGTGALAGFDVNVMHSYSKVGNYKVYLRVKNSRGLWSDGGTDIMPVMNGLYRREFQVDTPPTASFAIEKNPIYVEELMKLKDTSTNTGLTPIIKWHWIVKKLKPDGSAPDTDIQNERFAKSNNGIGAMLGYDINVKTQYADVGPGTYRIFLRTMNGNGMWSDGGNDTTYNLGSFYYQDLVVQESFKISKFRVVKIRDLRLQSYYYNPATGRYDDRPVYADGMAVDFMNFGGLVDGLTKGYKFEFEIDTANFNDDTDTIKIIPHFYTCDNYARDAEERELYWENSWHQVLKAGEGGHAAWADIVLTKEERLIKADGNATWRGSYLIPGTAWAVPKGTFTADAKSAKISKDIIVNFEIKGYRAEQLKYDYNLLQWPLERTIEKYPYEVGDVIRYSHLKNNLEDIDVILNRP